MVVVVVGAGSIVSFFLQQMCHSSSQGLIQIILASDVFSGLTQSGSVKLFWYRVLHVSVTFGPLTWQLDHPKDQDGKGCT